MPGDTRRALAGNHRLRLSTSFATGTPFVRRIHILGGIECDAAFQPVGGSERPETTDRAEVRTLRGRRRRDATSADPCPWLRRFRPTPQAGKQASHSITRGYEYERTNGVPVSKGGYLSLNRCFRAAPALYPPACNEPCWSVNHVFGPKVKLCSVWHSLTI